MKFQKGILLKNYTTFRIGGPAKYFFIAKTKTELIKVIQEAKKYNLPLFILSGGSNLLITDQGYKGIVIKIENQKLKIKNNHIFVEAGVVLSQLVKLALKNNLTGLEWAAGIPGTVGGAVAGNAGAFDGVMADVVKKVEIFNLKSQKINNFQNRDCQFGYRNSIFKKNNNLIILSCELQLKSGNKNKIKEKMQAYLNYRNLRHPKQPSAGSVFQNIDFKKLPKNFFKKFPEAKKNVKENILPAAYFIDHCGLKRKKIGGAQISELHPNFIINLGEAKAQDVLKLINLVKKTVNKKFGIKFKEEIQILK